jgi:nitrogen regulatory protein PII-like uncharacterized protein
VGDFEDVVRKQSRDHSKKAVSINPEVTQEKVQKKKEKTKENKSG